ncbi:methylmalonyl-CoA mutase N-terminal domain-containing protein [Striga asiatica]|uniref:Methylmalonyl-CoA mutase N-terminal domain-containing protein n=1 Tax=Striga asiatica TaxID=4170 RepID=A0A5A7QP96_STRAF|nr:methylmalonyl-CoA mutase N-terminal domain-containing protein [Striga asiatica]
MPTFPLHFWPMSLLPRTNEHETITARPRPLTNRSPAYIHTFTENTVRHPKTDMMRHDRANMFFWPRLESANMEGAGQLIRQLRKKDKAGRPWTIGLAHWRAHWDTVDECTGEFQDHEPSGSRHMSEHATRD